MTKEVLYEDGWNFSGDIGELCLDRGLKIIERKKNIYKLSKEKYIAPEKIENIYARVKFIAQTFVYGDSLKDYNVKNCLSYFIIILLLSNFTFTTSFQTFQVSFIL